MVEQLANVSLQVKNKKADYYATVYSTTMTLRNTSLKDMTSELRYWDILGTVSLSLISSHTSRGISKKNPMILHFLLQFS